MAISETTDLLKVWRGLMRYWSRSLEEAAFSKPELYDAIVAIDTYFSDNAAAINNELPAAFKANATVNQKAVLFAAVALLRYNPDLLKNLLGEVNNG